MLLICLNMDDHFIHEWIWGTDPCWLHDVMFLFSGFVTSRASNMWCAILVSIVTIISWHSHSKRSMSCLSPSWDSIWLYPSSSFAISNGGLYQYLSPISVFVSKMGDTSIYVYCSKEHNFQINFLNHLIWVFPSIFSQTQWNNHGNLLHVRWPPLQINESLAQPKQLNVSVQIITTSHIRKYISQSKQ